MFEFSVYDQNWHYIGSFWAGKNYMDGLNYRRTFDKKSTCKIIGVCPNSPLIKKSKFLYIKANFY